MSNTYSYLKKVKVLVSDLKIGMYVGSLDRDWSETTFLFQGFPINEQADITALCSQCNFVFVDFPSVAEYTTYLRSIKSTAGIRSKIQQRDVQEELTDAAEAFISTSKVVKTILDSISLGESFDVESVKSVVQSCVYSILRNDDALIMLTQIRNRDEYTAEHCMRVGIVSIAFAKYLGLSEEQMQDLGICGMLHDVGKMMTPDDILNKPGSLTDEEMGIMRQHASLGYEILLQKKDLTPSAVDVVYAHHERLNGSGYPRALTEDKISYNAKLVAIVDVNDAVTSDRVFAKARTVSESYKILMDGRGELYDSELVLKFIEWQGVFPTGSIIEMTNGQLGIVLSVNRERKLKPKVLLLTDEEHLPRTPKVVDLSKMELDAIGNYYVIKATHVDGYCGIKLRDHLQRGLKLAH